MTIFLKTLLIAGVLLGLCVIGLGIGYFTTGKNRFNCKRCGKPEDCPCKKKKK